MKYAYFLASQISNVVVSKDWFEQLHNLLWPSAIEPDDYFKELLNENIEKLIKPSKESILHVFIRDTFNMEISARLYHFNDELCREDIDFIEQFLEENFIHILQYYNVHTPDYQGVLHRINNDYESELITEDDYENRIKELAEQLSNLIDQVEDTIVNETFYLLYNDKSFLFEFNNLLSPYIKKNGLIKRCSYIPKWLEKAIFFRDNGICQHCGKDLTGFITIIEDHGRHFDHIIPLDSGGTNDPTNFQLLCSSCNLTKSSRIIKPKYFYQFYW